MTLAAWFSLAVTLAVFIGLVLNLASADVLFVAAISLLVLAKIITPAEAMSGFSNPGMLTVAALFIVAAGLRDTGVLDWAGNRILGRTKTERGALVRIAGFVVPLSACLNNTPIVAMLMPVVMDWCRRHRVSPSKLLIPLSYFTILGGTCTLIGTSTNLVVNGLMIRAYAEKPADPQDSQAARFHEELRGFHLLEIGLVGIPYAIIGTLYICTLGRRVLPERKELLEQLGEQRREYLVEMLVQPGCRLVGESVESAGLRHLPGLFLIEIDRNGRIISPVNPDEFFQANDRLVFTGVVSTIVELEKIPGLVPAADPAYTFSTSGRRNRLLTEAVVSPTSPLIGQSIREADFRARYNVAVVAVHRNGQRVTNKVGDVELRPGDTLLLQTRPHFSRANRNNPDFYLISEIEDSRPLRSDRAWLAVLLFAVLVGVMASGKVEIAIACMGIAALMVLTDCLPSGEAHKSVEWQVILTIAASFGVGQALENTGAARFVAENLVRMTHGYGPVAALAAMYLITMIVTEVITNNAAAVLMFPFCLETARALEVSPRPFMVALLLAASASFITPIGYQTNMMVYGPGGYRFNDFVRIGTPLSAATWLTATLLIPVFWPF